MAPPSRSPEQEAGVLELRTGGPHGLELRVRRVGHGLECLVSAAGTASPGTRLRAREPGGEPVHERALARHLAHRLSRAARSDVSCELSLGTRAGEPGLREALEELVRAAARALEEARLSAALESSPWAQALLAPATAARDEVAALLATPHGRLLARLAPEAARIGTERFGGRVQLFAPLYLSDACQNDCAYCGFRRSHARRRTHLTLEQALAEARALAAQGLRTVDLVTGEVPSERFVDGVARAVEAILGRTPIERVHLNLGALSLAQYRRLRAAGATGYHVYQETYDPAAYLAAHRGGPKRDMAFRLEAPERAIHAGFERIGLGVLLGLAEPAGDLAALARHAELLSAAHPGLRLGFSLPRLRAAGGGCSFDAPHAVGDELFEKAVLFLRTRFPDAHSTLTTRERPALRDALLPLGITRLSAGVRTAPGGYAGTRAGTEQFSIGDPRTVAEVAAAVHAAGRTPVP